MPGIVGFAKALDLCMAELPTSMTGLAGLRDRLAAEILQRLDDVVFAARPSTERYTDGTPLRLPGNLDLSFGNVDGEALLLAMGGLAVSSGAACSSSDPEPSHVLRALGLGDDAARSSLRFGLGRFNTAADVEFAAQRVVHAASELRKLA